MSTSKKYINLNTMLQQDKISRDYFFSLPNYVQDQINTRGSNVNSLSSLQDYAENLLRGKQKSR